MTIVVQILIAILNAVGPGIIDLIKSVATHPALDDNGKAAIAALHAQLEADRADLAREASDPLPVPDPKPTAPG